MIKRLKRKYILVVMCVVIAVIGIIVAAINIVSYSSVNSQLDEILTLIVDNEGNMPDFSPPKPDKPDNDGNTQSPDGEEQEGDGNEQTDENERQEFSPETPFATRYFVVKFNTDGDVISVNVDKTASVDELQAKEYAMSVFGDRERGYYEYFKYMSGQTSDGNIIYVFLNAERELGSIRSFFGASCIISVIGLVMIFVIVLLLSETALKPIIESYEKQKRFITDAGHEMKTPLTVISANTEIIEMENGESQWTSGIKSQVSKLASLTEKLVILSKMEEGIKLDMNEFSLSEAVFDTCEQYRSMAVSADVRFEVNVPENVLMIGNEGEIRRCITLLLDNAFRYVGGEGMIKVGIQKLPSGVEMRFENSTDGVEKGSLDRWFDRFYRTDLSRNSATGGSGIGLSVVRAIVLAHGGSLHARSEDGINVEFLINI